MDKIHIGSRRGEMSCVVWHTKSENRYVNYNKSDLCVEILKNEYITEWVIDMSSKIKIALAVVIVIMLGINVAIILHGVPKNNPVVKQQKLSQNSIFINQQQVLQKEKRSFQVVSLANESSNQTQATTTRQSTPTSGSNGVYLLYERRGLGSLADQAETRSFSKTGRMVGVPSVRAWHRSRRSVNNCLD